MARRRTGQPEDALCPCGSGQPLPNCCGPYVQGQQSAPNPSALMRSRYTAYTQGNASYLLDTWHSATRPARLSLDEDPRPHWLGLKIVAVSDDPPTVEFVARYRVGGKGHRLHERSRFVLEDGRWWYYDGVLDPAS